MKNRILHGGDGGNQKEQESYPIEILFVDSLTDFKPESVDKIWLSHTKQAISVKQISKSAQLWMQKTFSPLDTKLCAPNPLRFVASQPWKGLSF